METLIRPQACLSEYIFGLHRQEGMEMAGNISGKLTR
jgi:hypothetical protein